MFVQGHGQKSEQKHRTKNFDKLPNHLPLLTMAACLSFALHAALVIGALRVFVCVIFEFILHAALAIGALQMLLAACLSFVLHAALAIGALRVLVCQMFKFVCMLLLPSGLCRCFWPHV